MGLPYADFWDLAPCEIAVISRGYRRRVSAEMRRGRILNQELGQLVAYAQHQPDKMPNLVEEADRAQAGPAPRAGPPAMDPDTARKMMRAMFGRTARRAATRAEGAR